jgi:hypothetical protein
LTSLTGVIEALNKQGKPGAKSRPYFTEKDEQALENICRLAAQLLERVPEYFPSLKVLRKLPRSLSHMTRNTQFVHTRATNNTTTQRTTKD